MSAEGFTYRFRDLSYQYGQYHKLHSPVEEEESGELYLTSFVSWPYSEKITQDDKCEFLHCRVNLNLLPCPKDKFYDKISEKDKKRIALTDMRKCLEEYKQNDADGVEKPLLAHIFIGGRKSGFIGDKPGILEEFLSAKEHKHPIFLLGGFGGETEVIVKHLLEGNDDVPELKGIGVADLNDGIVDDGQRRILSSSTNIVEIIPILLQSLKKLVGG